jgi:hypothetical protein
MEAYRAGVQMALIVEDDMDILRWPSHKFIFTSPPEWDILLLYMMGEHAERIYRHATYHTISLCSYCTVHWLLALATANFTGKCSAEVESARCNS